MVNIYTDTDKLKIICDFTNHQNFPYGTTTLTFDINGLSMDATNELILFNNLIGGFVFASFVGDLYFNGVKATMETVNQMFQDTCFNCCGSGGGGDIHIDTDDIVNALDKINETLKKGGGGTGHCECDMWTLHYVTIDEFNNMEHIADDSYFIYCDCDECEGYNPEDIDTKLKRTRIEKHTDCSGTTKIVYEITYKEHSEDGGNTWIIDDRTTEIIDVEKDCPECGYVPQEEKYVGMIKFIDGTPQWRINEMLCINKDNPSVNMDINFINSEDEHKGGYGTSLVVELTKIEPYLYRIVFDNTYPNKMYDTYYWMKMGVRTDDVFVEWFELPSIVDCLDGVYLSDKVIFPSTMKEVGFKYNPLQHDSSLRIKHIVFQEGTERIIGFQGIGGYIEKIDLPNTLKYIDGAAFYMFTHLTEIVLPSSLIEIGSEAFRACSNLSNVTYNGTMEEWNNISKGENIFALTNVRFIHCSDGNIQIN